MIRVAPLIEHPCTNIVRVHDAKQREKNGSNYRHHKAKTADLYPPGLVTLEASLKVVFALLAEPHHLRFSLCAHTEILQKLMIQAISFGQ